ncbi:hypothetical protein IW262DRAFT_1296676 [Armillaria fumosa]|nr:hypothetical protein IW262DRAFT_1296676 [Armillaria fumosa]
MTTIFAADTLNVYRVPSDAYIANLVEVIATERKIDYSSLVLWTPKQPVSQVGAATHLAERLSKAHGNLDAVATKVEDPEQNVKDFLRFNRGGQGRMNSEELHFILEIRSIKRKREKDEDDGYDYLLSMAPPIQLYHPVFAYFLRAMGNTSDLPEGLVVETGGLMRRASGIEVTEYERSRTLSSCMHLSTILGFPLNRTSTGHAIFHNRRKVGVGVWGDSVTTQGGCSYMDFWLSEDHQELRQCGCSPSFILCLAGPWLIVMGAVLSLPSQQFSVSQTSYGSEPVPLSTMRSVSVLLASYEPSGQRSRALTPSSGDSHPHFFPFPTSFQNDNQPRVHFKYLQPLKPLDPACVVFLPEIIPDKSKVIIKFVQTYGVEAHRLLVQHRLAPHLLYCEHLGEDGAGEVATEMFGGALAPEVVIDLERALNILHREDLVFGDLRKPNIMIVAGRNGDDRDTARLINFDWAGKENEVRYPIHLNLSKEVKWADGVGSYRKIEKKHDLGMLVFLKGRVP